ncbi:hypothetical protein [Lysobacter silvisoli]|uniref:hypothetical protein n=1 Tax=Lysobacter silvisoli TaxID=2293254 RepID=UPI0011C07B1A|nr:hypothetical protein [Lysobacter silvisoli]
MSRIMIFTGKKEQVRAKENALEHAGVEFKVLLRRGPYDKLQAEKLNDNPQDWTATDDDTCCAVLEVS